MYTEKEKDLFENKGVLSAIMTIALPSILGQLILVIYNMADTFFVGLTGKDEMITAVTVCMPAFMFISAISNLFGIGGASVISRALGKNNIERAKHASSFAVWGCISVTIIYSLLAFIFRNTFVDLLGGKDTIVHSNSLDYLIVAIVICGLPTALNTLFSHLLRSQGMSVHASIGIGLGGILNVLLDPLFMFVILDPTRAALGAAIATGISNIVALVYYILLFVILKGKLIVSIRPSKDIFGEAIPKNVIKIGIPACLMTLCENISYAILDNLMYGVGEAIEIGLGKATQAGVGVAKKINMLAHSIVRGMTQGVLPLIGYNKSSGNRKRMRAVVLTSGAISLIIATICMVVSLVFSRELVSLFIQNETTGSLEYGAKFLKILCLGAPFSAIAYTVISFFQAVGKAWRSLILALLRKGILDIPLMFILKGTIPTYGIVWATPIADIICSIVALALFSYYIKYHSNNRGAYKEEVVDEEPIQYL